ncbi:hypothetical protein HU200_010801 [Digitaria exilis]|uniref:AB hydrolase-1 domain-containing protein n=1 Tax=Digitaria exilis TaxID=1010633 RepID=A0A835KR97_9POAL|nr:hypothetical protein HU200_010801 [Digitaria exilis]
MFGPAIMSGGKSSSAVVSLTILLCIEAAVLAVAARPILDAPRAAANGTCQSGVRPFGYNCEETPRIPGGRGDSGQLGGRQEPGAAATRAPHGRGDVAGELPRESLGYILADSGYDVWIANSRAPSTAADTPRYPPATRSFMFDRTLEAWNLIISIILTFGKDHAGVLDWSWDELASDDLSAVVQYVYARSGQQKMHYVGHSLGTLIAFAALSERWQLGMLRSAGLLSPIAYLERVSSPLARAAADVFLGEALYWLGLDEFDPTGETVHKLVTDVCSLPGINCYNLMSVFTGDNCCLDNSSVQVFLAHEPQASATKNMIHLAQMIRRGTIAKYDYGNAADNTKHYGQATPPPYDVSAIPDDFPLFLSYGGKDSLSDPQDVAHLIRSLQSHDSDKLTVQYLDDYAHADFVMAGNANERVYAPLMAFFKLQEK